MTPLPVVEVEGRRVSIRSGTSAASLGYRIGAGRWRLDTGPFDAPRGSHVCARAVRYGWDASAVVRAAIPAE